MKRMGEPFHNHFLENLSGWWCMIESKNHWKVPSLLPSSFISLCLWREKEMFSPWNFDELSLAPDLQLVGARENVYKGWWGGNIQIFSLWGGGRRFSLLPWNITTGAVSESETSCLTSRYWCLCEKQEKTKKNMVWQQEVFLITRKHYLPSFSLYLL